MNGLFSTPGQRAKLQRDRLRWGVWTHLSLRLRKRLGNSLLRGEMGKEVDKAFVTSRFIPCAAHSSSKHVTHDGFVECIGADGEKREGITARVAPGG